MSKQTNFKKIFIIIGVLLALLVIVKLKDRKQGDRSFKAYVVQVDTAEVNSINITPKGKTESLNLIKENGNWLISINNKKVDADKGLINSLLEQASGLKTKSIAASSKEKWAAYEVTDSAASRVVLKNNKKILSDFLIGKFSYKQLPQQAQSPYQQQPNIQMTSYVRLNNENEVYAVDGFLSMMFNRETNAFRSKTVVSGNKNDWTKIVYSYPADSSFTLVKQNDKWLVNGTLADSASVAGYLSSINNLSASDYDNDMELFDGQQTAFSVKIEGNNTSAIEVKAYTNSSGELVYSSSENRGNILKSPAIQSTLFVSKEKFIQAQ